MKRIFTILLLCICCLVGFAEQLPLLMKPSVDKRAELLSIVFRLAGRPEYNRTDFKLYTDRIATHFNKWKDHELIAFARSLVASNGVSYDAVMNMAVNLDDKFNLNEDYSALDIRWNRAKVRKFEILLKKFVKDTRFEQFYRQNEPLYREAEKRFMPIYEKIDTKWYTDFYGIKSKDIFHIILSMSNGGSNYGAQAIGKNGVRNVYSFMGAWPTDSTGMIVYPIDDIFPIMIHEFNHSFANFNAEDFRASGERIYAVLKDQMESQAYGRWETVLAEALVRASVVKYMKDHGFNDGNVAKEIMMQKRNGFLWIDRLYDELEKYAADRKTYPTLESYMPQLVKVYGDFASYTEHYDNFRPKVLWVSEFVNGDSTVSSGLKTITIHFDRPLVGRGYSFNYGRFGDKSMPKIKNVSYTNNNYTAVVDVELQPDQNYSMNLIGFAFRTAQNDGMKPYEIYFRTAQ